MIVTTPHSPLVVGHVFQAYLPHVHIGPSEAGAIRGSELAGIVAGVPDCGYVAVIDALVVGSQQQSRAHTVGEAHVVIFRDVEIPLFGEQPSVFVKPAHVDARGVRCAHRQYLRDLDHPAEPDADSKRIVIPAVGEVAGAARPHGKGLQALRPEPLIGDQRGNAERMGGRQLVAERRRDDHLHQVHSQTRRAAQQVIALHTGRSASGTRAAVCLAGRWVLGIQAAMAKDRYTERQIARQHPVVPELRDRKKIALAVSGSVKHPTHASSPARAAPGAEQLRTDVEAIPDPYHAGRVVRAAERILRQSSRGSAHPLGLHPVAVGKVPVGGGRHAGRRADRHNPKPDQRPPLHARLPVAFFQTQ